MPSGVMDTARRDDGTEGASGDVPDRAQALAELVGVERTAFLLTERMNQGKWKRFWSVWQRSVGAWWVAAATSNHLQVAGFEHVEATSPERPLLLVSNHRAYFDFLVVTSILYRRLGRPIQIFFPIRGRGYYQHWSGVALNLFGGFWSMFPPLFALPTHRAFDRYALEVLIGLCRTGRGHVIGIHPEGGRNRDPDPYTYRRFQPGAGRIIHAARPQVIPVFLAGVENNPVRFLTGRWRGGDIRVRFGAAVDLAPFAGLPAKGSTYKRITEHVMEQVRLLGEADRAARSVSAPASPASPAT